MEVEWVAELVVRPFQAFPAEPNVKAAHNTEP